MPGNGSCTISPRHWAALPDEVRRALLRSGLFRTLAWSLLYPEPGRLEDLFNSLDECLERRKGLPTHQPAFDALSRLAGFRETEAARLQAQHDRVFGHTISAECPPYETQYGAGIIFAQAQRLGDIAAFYRAFGVALSPEARERVDHAAAELEFLATLALREAACLIEDDKERLATVRAAQRSFLVEHLAAWGLCFAERLERKARAVLPPEGGFYAAVAAALAALLRDELRLFHLLEECLVPVEPVQFDFEPEGSCFACGPAGEPVLYQLPGAAP